MGLPRENNSAGRGQLELTTTNDPDWLVNVIVDELGPVLQEHGYRVLASKHDETDGAHHALIELGGGRAKLTFWFVPNRHELEFYYEPSGLPKLAIQDALDPVLEKYEVVPVFGDANNLASRLRKIREILQDRGGPLLRCEPEYLADAVARMNKKNAENTMRSTMGPLRAKANEHWSGRRYAELVPVLIKMRPHLTPLEEKRLDYALRAIAGNAGEPSG